MEIIRVSMQMDLKLNVKSQDDIFGKNVHRRVAQKLGIPNNIAYRIKEAAEHGSGMHQIFDAIARSHGFDESTTPMGYLENLRLRERIGSSQRYGHLFENERQMYRCIWIAFQRHCQFSNKIWWRNPLKGEKEHINHKVDKNDEAPIYFGEEHKFKQDMFIPLDKETGQPHECDAVQR